MTRPRLSFALPPMRARHSLCGLLVLSLPLFACTGSAPAPDAGFVPQRGRLADAAPRPVATADLNYTRESYVYPRRAGDPFASLATLELEVRPHIEDVTVVAIVVDRDPRRSVVLLQTTAGSTQTDDHHRLHVGESLGNFRVTAIRVNGLTIETRVKGRMTPMLVPFDPSGAP